MTQRWYAAVLDKLKKGDRILDIGIGTATALVRNKDALLTKHLSVVGIDYEAAYVQKAEEVCRAADLWRPVPEGTEGYRPGDYYCRVHEMSIYDEGLKKLCGSKMDTADGHVPEEDRFDVAYFSGSLTLMPDPPAALRAVVPVIKKESGRVFVTQTFQKQYSPFMATIKPLLKYLTTIDFGQLTTQADVDRIIAEAGIFEVVENKPIAGSINTPLQTALLIELRVKKGS